jgi:selenium metabolism protein YedF
MERQVDCRGLVCPKPVIETRKALDEMGQGTLEVLVDKEISAKNISRMATRLGHAVAVEERAGEYAVRIEKAGEPAAEAAAQVEVTPTVFVSSKRFGRGYDELGEILMKSFLYSLTQMQEPPSAVVFANSGVELAVEGSESLETLKELVDRGVELIVCGTCLDYLKLGDRLAVGEVSNMQEIAETLAASPKVIAV